MSITTLATPTDNASNISRVRVPLLLRLCTANSRRSLARIAVARKKWRAKALRWLERHPASTQLFAPLGGGRYLLVVAAGEDAPDLDTLAAFVVEGAVAITYRPGIWHHPMVALDAALDFVNVLAVDGSDGDCDERAYDPPCARVTLGASTT